METPRKHSPEQDLDPSGIGPVDHGIRPLVSIVALVLIGGLTVSGSISALTNYDLIGLGHLPRAAVFCIVILVVCNALFAWIRRRRLFSTADLAYVYIVILMMIGIPGVLMVTFFYLGLIGAPYHAGSSTNEYATQILPYIKPWMVPTGDFEHPNIAWAFHGLPFGESVPWEGWVRPILAWTPHILAVFALQIFAAALFQRRWDEERLTYPLAQAPMEIVSYARGDHAWPTVMRHWLFWAAFAIPVFIHTKNAFAIYYPHLLSRIDLNKNLGVIFGEPPWFYFDNFPIQVYFETIGATYLIPVATGLSLWLFWVLRRFVCVYRHQRGLPGHEWYMKQQGNGAYLVLAALCVWGSRKTITAGLRGEEAPGRASTIRPRAALAGVLGSLTVLLVWAYCAGGIRTVAPTFVMLLLYLVAVLVVSRLVAEYGLFVVFSPVCEPQDAVMKLWGTWPGFDAKSNQWRQTAVALGFMGWRTQHTGGATMPNALQAFRIGKLAHINAGHIVWGIAVGIVVAMLVVHPPSLHAIYSQGVYDLGWWPRGVTEDIPNRIRNGADSLAPYTASDGWAVLHGAAVVTGLYLVRTRYHHFPLQPFAYAAVLGPQWAMDRYGFSIFLGWLAKALVLRYWGIRASNKLKPAALGMIAGNATILMFWTLCSLIWPMNGVLVIE